MLFNNDDACGDRIIAWGENKQFSFQCWNTVSSILYLISGLQILTSARYSRARAYGVGNCFIALGAVFFHSTSTVVGFVGDIVGIASCSTLLISGAVYAVTSRLGYDMNAPSSEFIQLVFPMVAAFIAVSIPSIMLVAGVPHPDVWGAWAGNLALIVIALCITVAALFCDKPWSVIVLALFWVVAYVPWVMAVSGLPSLPQMVFLVSSQEIVACSSTFLLVTYAALVGWARRKWIGSLSVYRDLLIALTCILLGLGCTLHSVVPGMCTEWRQKFPLHVAWHIFSAITLNRAGHLLDVLVSVAHVKHSKAE